MTKSEKLLKAPIAEWPLAITCLPKKSDTQDVELELEQLIQRATLLYAYIGRRYNSGCGEKEHGESAKAANSMLVKVRRAMGFTVPENTPTCIR